MKRSWRGLVWRAWERWVSVSEWPGLGSKVSSIQVCLASPVGKGEECQICDGGGALSALVLSGGLQGVGQRSWEEGL